ncbi:netrin-1 [Stigmatopora argus]
MMSQDFSLPTSTLVVLLLLYLLPRPLLPSSPSPRPLSWTSPQDPCYQPDGRPRHCLSEFIDAAHGVSVDAGRSLPGSAFRGDVGTLTVLENPRNLTCWRAEGSRDGGDWVLTVPLGRRFEIAYVSLQFCHRGEPSDPLSVSVFKSMDYRNTWRPMQHYSADCLGDFGLPARTAAATRQQETEPLCSDPRPLQRRRGGAVLAFSALDGRPSSPDFDYSPTLQDWVTATDIRVVFHQKRDSLGAGGGRDPARWPDAKKWDTGSQRREDQARGRARLADGNNVTRQESALGRGAPFRKATKFPNLGGENADNLWLLCPNGECDWSAEAGPRRRDGKGRELRKRRNNRPAAGESSGNPRGAPAPPLLVLSDLQVGGRCKCNGHASKCRRDHAGRARCVCEHHTAGPDCDVCEDFYLDRPWHRATPTQPNPCVACECNGHSKKCRFSMEAFQQSGRRSGGVCLKCRHHTAGRHCQYCHIGYTRDQSKPPRHRRACRPCQCNPLGAVGRGCNNTSGQCLCRQGVTGLRCNRCALGYKRGTSPLRPCVPTEDAAPTPVFQPQYAIDEECASHCQPSQGRVRMNLDTYCLKDYVLKAQVKGKERSGPWWNFSIYVQVVFRSGSPSRLRRGPQSLWVPDRDLTCGCPALQAGRTFLLIGADGDQGGRAPDESRLVADRSTLALQWRDHWSSKLRGFRGQDKRGGCPERPPRQTGGHSEPPTGYVPPHLRAKAGGE